MEKRTILVRAIPVALWKRLKIRAVSDDETLGTTLVKAIEKYLDANEKAA
jgi:hypothetical protein